MAALTVEVTIPEALRERFEARVQAHGGDPTDYLRELLERDLNGDERPHAGMSFREILAGTEEGFAASRMTDDELAEFLNAKVHAYRAEQRGERERSK